MNEITVRLGMSTSDIAAGAQDTLRALETHVHHRDLPVTIKQTGSLGISYREPVLAVDTPDGTFLYGPVTPERVRPIIDRHLKASSRGVSPDWVISEKSDFSDYPFLHKQHKVATQNSGVIDPHSFDDYVAGGGYAALERARTMSPDAVIQTVLDSKLRGRGGAGFSTGLKWGFLAKKTAPQKYLICNADEGDPGAFMDRAMIEGDPHRLLEGMLIGAYATGASVGYLYVRAEYPLAVRLLRGAIRQLEDEGLIGKDAFGAGRDFRFVIKEGAGAFVCGEETALMHSIEGKRGMPRMRPPYPADHGLWGYPSNINNVETFCNIPSIIANGAEWYASLGTEKSGGTKAFALAGAIQKTGLVEVPIGTTLRELLFDIGGGPLPGREFKAVQLGGPSGGCIPASLLDTPIDYDTIAATGAIMGSGGMIVIDDTTSMVEIARYFLSFTQEESCGKCLPCRVGTRKMLNILDRIVAGDGAPADIDQLHRLSSTIGATSLCGLGQTAPNPVLTTLRYFEHEYAAAMRGNGHQPAEVTA